MSACVGKKTADKLRFWFGPCKPEIRVWQGKVVLADAMGRAFDLRGALVAITAQRRTDAPAGFRLVTELGEVALHTGGLMQRHKNHEQVHGKKRKRPACLCCKLPIVLHGPEYSVALAIRAQAESTTARFVAPLS
ncbi:hypothetical protein DEVEQU_00163 [Devosia equisanguinis]|uniref:Uncharacterized protein n=1 Tax=Devosia equisanguinis TaxID=2490941 RepID=A0A3S4CAX1_9HYPH|nr:hypothetical protein DEVEQU_00163 [Devosia equisanguinis]